MDLKKKKKQTPQPYYPSPDKWGLFGLRLCHIKPCLGMLQTYHNYLMDSGLRQSWMENFHTHTHTPLKRQLPNLQGNRFWYLSLTALPVDCISPWKKIEHTLAGSFWMFSFGFSSASFEAKTRQNTCTWTAEGTCQVPFHPGKQHPALASVLQLHWGMCCLWAPALQSPCSQTLCGFIYTYFHISFLYVPAASVWQQVTKCYRFYYGRQVRRHHAEQSQFRKLPPIRIAEVTFYPGCAIAVI